MLLRSESHGASVPEDNGWRRLSSELQIVAVPGDHQTMLRPPLVATTAERLRAALRDAESAGVAAGPTATGLGAATAVTLT